MNEVELIHRLHSLNEEELFYRNYQISKKNPETFKAFLANINIDECLKKHLIIPEIKETMPPSMKDEYFFNQVEIGISVQKHNCYSPAFEHYHSYFEALYVYEGTCEHTVNNSTSTLKLGDFCIIPPGTSHSIYVGDQSIIIVMIIKVSAIENTFKNPTYYKDNLLADFFLRNTHYSNPNSYLMFHTGNDTELKDIIVKMIVEHTNKYQEYDAMLYAYFSLFFANLVRNYERTIELSDYLNYNSTEAFEIVDYIKNHHADCTLDSIARRYHYSSEYTSKFIKLATGKTFSEILISARLNQTIQLLKSTNLSISDIAYQVGYSNAESLIRLFKKQYHKTPSEYRKFLQQII